MQLAYAPLVLILVGLVAYTILAGADFGTGVWELTARRGPRALALRDFAHDAMGPVWEANHVWLVFVLVVCWSTYRRRSARSSRRCRSVLCRRGGHHPARFGVRLRADAWTHRERGLIDDLFALSSILTPFALARRSAASPPATCRWATPPAAWSRAG
jgi:cytochrome d ubiquinol oxidase subunit II